MGVERVDYYSDDEYQQALQHEQQSQNWEEQEQEQEPDQVDMMSEDELRQELRRMISQNCDLCRTIAKQREGEFICSKCGLRQDEHVAKDDIPF